MREGLSAMADNEGTGRLPRIAFGLSWLIVIPAGVWAVVNVYIPVFGGTLNPLQTWTVTLIVGLLVAASLVCHVLAHFGAARILEGTKPPKVTLLISGDVAQGWTAAASPGRETLAASAGPVTNLLLAGLGYLLWNAQISTVLNLGMLFAAAFNAWLFLINLIPAFPLDGGRLVGAATRGLAQRSGPGRRPARLFALIIAAALCAWGGFLIAQHSRFSWQTGAITFGLAILIVDGIRTPPAPQADEPRAAAPSLQARFLRCLAAGLVTLILLGASSSLLLTNDGLEAPGVAPAVQPMVEIPAPYRHTHRGEFLLTTVISQAPISAGEWVIGQVDPAVQIVPPETVLPRNTTFQKQAQQDYQMLGDSETTAIAVGLNLAGYSTAVVGKGVQVVSILPGSRATGLLQPGDVITGLNGKPIQTPSDLIDQIKTQSLLAPLRLKVRRGQTEREVDVALLPPLSPDSAPRLGIEIEPAGFDFRPPFPIAIVPQKIGGGPSAGLMFSLTVDDLLTPEGLTGGRKIAGTGTIDLGGSVGPIGGVKQKVAAAEAAGASYFLCPVENYADALSVARTIKVIKVGTAQQAVQFLQSLPPQ